VDRLLFFPDLNPAASFCIGDTIIFLKAFNKTLLTSGATFGVNGAGANVPLHVHGDRSEKGFEIAKGASLSSDAFSFKL
jgi:hypothetical protein